MDEPLAWAILAKNLNLRGRQKRNVDLLIIVEAINHLLDIGLTKSEIARRLGITSGMLGQFLAINDLPLDIQHLVKERKIDAVKTVHWLSKVKDQDNQKSLATLVVEGNIAGDNVPAAVRFLAKQQGVGFEEVISRIVNAKKQKINLTVVVIPLSKHLVAKLRQPGANFPERVQQTIFNVIRSLAPSCEVEIVIKGDFIFCLYNEQSYRLLRSILPSNKEPADIILDKIERTMIDATKDLG